MRSFSPILCVHWPIASCALACFVALAGCTCTPTGVTGSAEDRENRAGAASEAAQEVTIEVGALPGSLPVTLVLDPSGALCLAASRASAGKRHVLCDQTREDLAAAKLREALKRLKKQVGPAVAPDDAWVLSSAARAPVARALAIVEPTFFSRVAVWVGDSPKTASLFGPGFWHEVAKQGLHAVVLIGPGAKAAEGWTVLAGRQGVRLVPLPSRVGVDDPAVWATLDKEFGPSRSAP